MITFAKKNLDVVRNGKLIFYKLLRNNVDLYQDFCEDICKDAILSKELNIIHTYMNLLADSNLQLPTAKFNSIKHGKNVVGHEFKSKHLRVYVIKEDPNVYVILGGMKTTQKSDVSKFKKFIKEYNQFINNKIDLS